MDQRTDFLELARLAATRAGAVIAKHLGDGFGVKRKADGSPVTDADVAAEKIIIETIRERFPDHAIYGEETGRHAARGSAEEGDQSGVLWLIDPIDGTKSFVRGYPFFSTQIGVMVNVKPNQGDLVVGVSAAQHYQQTAWAIGGGSAQLNDQPLRVSNVNRIERASISTGNIASLARSSKWAALGGVLARADRTRGYGDFLHYHMLAAGQIDAVIESDVNILDISALAVIVTSAGGCFTDLDGGPIGLSTTSVLAAPPELHRRLLDALHG